MDEKRKTVIITGGTGAVGSRVTSHFFDAGYSIVIAYRSESHMENIETKVWNSPNTIGIRADLLNEADVDHLFHRTIEHFGSIDVLINTVGGWAGEREVSETSVKEWDFMLDLNLKTVFFSCRKAFAEMKRRGSGAIMNISSAVVQGDSSGTAAYTVAKAGVVSLTRSLALEGKHHGITANVVLPSTIDTPANRRAMPNADFSSWVNPDAIADLMLFLASDTGRNVTGAAIPIQGGQL
jgi:NAD(P)-dependent dehydrogenase (short-subunit alcohol dehydrogenase family)